jgi:hypothetical protein
VETLVYDAESCMCESKSVAQHLESVGHLLKELGPWCAAACLREVLVVAVPTEVVQPLTGTDALDVQMGLSGLEDDEDGEEDWCVLVAADAISAARMSVCHCIANSMLEEEHVVDEGLRVGVS